VSHAKLSYQKNNTTISALARYIGSMETIYDMTKQNPDNTIGARVGDKIDSYSVVDLNFRQDNLYKNLYMNFKISNLLDTEIRYPNNQETNELLDRGTIGEERKYVLTIGVKF